MPGFGEVKGEGGEHNEGAAAEGESEPAGAGGEFEGGIGCAPVPSSEDEKKESGGKGEDFPKEEVEGGEGEVDGKKNDEEGESGGVAENPTWNPRIAGPMGNAEEKGGAEEKVGGEGGCVGGQGEGEEAEAKGEKPREGVTEGEGHGSEGR
jgi:hypothetical protein